MLLSRLHSTAGVASILSSPALLTVLPFDAIALRSYTALVPLRWLRWAEARDGCEGPARTLDPMCSSPLLPSGRLERLWRRDELASVP
jgi:hypothetical protein